MRRSALLLSSLLFAFSSFAVEFPFASSEPGPAPYFRGNAETATNGSGYLVVWPESRPNTSEVFGIRLSAEGVPVDNVSFRIARVDRLELIVDVAVASDGEEYLVAYSVVTTADETRTRFVRVTPQGQVIALPNDLLGGYALSLGWAGDSWIVAYGHTPRAAVLDEDGPVLRSDIVVAANPRALGMHVAPFGNRVFLSWVHDADGRVNGATLTAGQLLDTQRTPITTNATTPVQQAHETRVACHAGGCLVVWHDGVASGATIRARRLDGAGQPIGAQMELGTASSVGAGAVLWTGSEYAIVYQRNTDVVVQRVAANGTPGALQTVATNRRVLSAGTVNGIITVITALHGLGGHFSYYATRVSPAAALPPVLISKSSPAQHSIASARCTAEINAFAWIDQSDREKVRFAESAGEFPLTARALRESADPQRFPAVACGGAHALVVWAEVPQPTNARRVWFSILHRANGTVYTAELGDTTGTAPAAAWNGSEYLVAWQTSDRELALTRITSDGRLIDPIPYVLQRARTEGGGTVGDANPAIAWNGTEYLLAWQHEHTLFPPIIITAPPFDRPELQIARLTRDLRLVNTVATLPRLLLPEGSAAGPPAVAAGTDGWIVSWRQEHGWGARTEWLASRVRRDGTLADTPAGTLIAAPWGDERISAIFQNGAYHVASGTRVATLGPTGAPIVRVHSDEVAGFVPGAQSLPTLVLSRPDPWESVPRLVVHVNPARRRAR